MKYVVVVSLAGVVVVSVEMMRGEDIVSEVVSKCKFAVMVVEAGREAFERPL